MSTLISLWGGCKLTACTAIKYCLVQDHPFGCFENIIVEVINLLAKLFVHEAWTPLVAGEIIVAVRTVGGRFKGISLDSAPVQKDSLSVEGEILGVALVFKTP